MMATKKVAFSVLTVTVGHQWGGWGSLLRLLLQTVSAASQNTTRSPAGGTALEENRWLAIFCERIIKNEPKRSKGRKENWYSSG
ncbi:MAG: hypothetical protein AB1547_06480 [Thermodesulfobacteriota bacterium]